MICTKKIDELVPLLKLKIYTRCCLSFICAQSIIWRLQYVERKILERKFHFYVIESL